MRLFASVPDLSAHGRATVPALRSTLDARRVLQLALALIWLLAGLVQLRDGPTPLAGLQLLIGFGIASRRAAAIAMAASVPCAVLWWFGGAAIGPHDSGATATIGAIAGVVITATPVVLLWPAAPSTAGGFVAARPVGATAAKIIWLLLWTGIGAMTLTVTTGPSSDQGGGDGHTAGLGAAGTGAMLHDAGTAIDLTTVGAGILLLIALSIFLPTRRSRIAAVVCAVVASVLIVAGGAAAVVCPLLALIALAYWPAPSAPAGTPGSGRPSG